LRYPSRKNIAIVGIGAWGKNYLNCIQRNDVLNIIALCDLRENVRKIYENDYKTVAHYQELCSLDEPLDAVIIATNVNSHYEISKYFLQKGIHVLCEKPLCKSSQSIKELNDIAISNEAVLLVGHTFLFNDSFKFVKNIVTTKHQDLKMFCERLGVNDRREDVGALLDLAPHDVSMVLALFQEMPDSVSAQARFSDEKIDFCNLQMIYPRAFANIVVSWDYPIKERKVKVVSKNQIIEFNDVSQERKISIINAEGIIEKPQIEHREPLLNLLQNFHFLIDRSVYSDDYVSNAGFAFKVARILELAKESIQNNGTKVRVEPKVTC